ncbi:hypothetical protein [Kitasatospora sp. NRRL B-11411]|uniref:hypothetical protein n=1 Tax=Kitasatospora sp. NRRL B-11411 TaxID=1463822 RepID=UPI0004C39AE9|nr:hypothetical protein [Kitasatospora sp. NRRL B-11411]
MTATLPAGALGMALARFPLTPEATSRVAPPLEQRLEEIAASARSAADHADAVLAAEVHRRAAQLHVDQGRPGTAYALCNLHTALVLQARPLPGPLAMCALTSQLTHAELLVREGHPGTAIALLEAISLAIGTNRDAETPAVGTLSLAGLSADDDRAVLYDWWEGISLLPLAHALARQGDWERARGTLMADPTPSPGPGAALQLATIALALGGRHQIAATRLARIRLDRHTPWEHVVAAALAVVCTLLGPCPDKHVLTGQLTTLCEAHGTYLERPDGYSARALLEHPLAARLPDTDRKELASIVEQAGLGTGALPPHLDNRLIQALALASEAVTAAITTGAP